MKKTKDLEEKIQIFEINSPSTPLYTMSSIDSHAMNKPTFLLLPFASLFFSSCGGDKNENYDTAPTPGYAAPNEAPATAAPTYQAAAYEENTAIPATPVDGSAVTPMPTDTGAVIPGAPAATAGAREHYVAPGDSLWKISNTYKVPIESIKAANQMTNDTVVLGKKLIIPAQ
jgi:LysM repeat protein